ncbi:MAG: 4-(cytidine 5'-diphospho)-2-C-methyl-D-erythritol kinase [Ruminiclostridium sp.]|nr:4-(cytidine 5'-diphospho)-2-C-methyl-D-erythritol kinase [Ruminiclostridium sp.]
MSLTVKAYAKINLWLDITGRRADGYHTLNTVMRRVGLYDTIDIAPTGGAECAIACDDPAVPCDGRNIAHRAWRLFAELYGEPLGARITIHKRIPLEAGLGGSSTDGAAVLLGLNELAGSPFTAERLAAESVRLGADVPFCVTGGTAECTGVGEIMRQIPCADFAAVIVKPEFSCLTAEAYTRYDKAPAPARAGFADYCRDIAGSAGAVAGGLYNVFEELYGDPRTDMIKRGLIAAGALGACMTGSGSAVFGVFPALSDAEAALKRIDGEIKFAVKAL